MSAKVTDYGHTVHKPAKEIFTLLGNAQSIGHCGFDGRLGYRIEERNISDGQQINICPQRNILLEFLYKMFEIGFMR